MSKELKRLKDWLAGYHEAIGRTGAVDDMVNDINNFIDVLIRDGEIAEHEKKKAEFIRGIAEKFPGAISKVITEEELNRCREGIAVDENGLIHDNRKL